MRLDPSLIDLSQVPSLTVGGRGGNEKQIAKIFLPELGWQRVNGPLFDFERKEGSAALRVEVKKQANLQWFDSGKYHELGADDKEIRMMFLLHDGRAVVVVAVAKLGEFLEWLYTNRSGNGWNKEVVEAGARFKRLYPALQFKAPVQVATMLREAPSLFDVLYRR